MFLVIPKPSKMSYLLIVCSFYLSTHEKNIPSFINIGFFETHKVEVDSEDNV